MAVPEQRQFPRVVLSIEDGFFGQLILPDRTRLMASIVNLSAGGVNFFLPIDKQKLISPGDILLLKNIVGAASLTFLEDVKTEIRWIKTLENAKSVSVGCQFSDLADPVRGQLLRFVESERITRGQYTDNGA